MFRFFPSLIVFSLVSTAGYADSVGDGDGLSDGRILKRLGAKMENGVTAEQLADYSRHFDLVDLDRDGSHSKVEYIEKGKYMSEQARRGIFGAADNDGDGIVTRVEYLLNRIITDEGKSIMQAMDDDKDGAIQEAEFTSHASDRLQTEESASQAFAVFDTDGNGEVRIPEYLRVWGKLARVGRKPAAERIASLENRILKTVRTDAEMGRDAVFDLLDRDKDGKLSEDEITEALAKLSRDADAALDEIVAKPRRQFQNDLDAKETLEAFLNAETVDELLPLVLDADELEARMREYHKEDAREPIAVKASTFDSSGIVPGTGLTASMFWVTVGERQIPVSVDETEFGYKVDWVAFTELLDGIFESFIQKSESPAGNFLVQFRRSHYFGNDMPEIDRFHTFRVQSPIAPFEDAYVFLRKDNPAAKEILEKYRWSTGYRPVVELKWNQPKGGTPWIELVRIVRHAWRR